MNISPISPYQSFLQMLQYGGQLSSALPAMNATQMIVGNSTNTTAGLIDGINYTAPGENTLSNLLSTNTSNLNSLFNQLA